ncbi:hypothetical protein ACXWQU_09290, partial [Streptococcus pyogenes]
RIEHPCIKATFIMESEGFVIDEREVAKQREEGYKHLDELQEAIQETFGDVNIGSPQQLSKMLYFDNDWSKYVTRDKKSILSGHVGFDDHYISNNRKFALVEGKKLLINPRVVNGETVGDSLPTDSDALKAIAKH